MSKNLKSNKKPEIIELIKLKWKIDKIKRQNKIIIKEVKEIERVGLKLFEIVKANVIQELEEVGLKSRKLEIITRMKKDLE